MGQLNFRKVAARTGLKREKVLLPEFDDEPQEDENLQTFTWVRELTAADKQILGQYGRRGYVDASAACIAALTAVDAAGNLTFGKTPVEAVENVLGLPESYNLMIIRISMVALKLTGNRRDEGKPLSDVEMLEEAKKN